MNRILIVEDEPHIMALLDAVITALGHDVLKAGDGLEALHILDNEMGPEVNMLVTDINLPRMDGR